MASGILDLTERKLIIGTATMIEKHENFEKDITFMAPEVPAMIFAEEEVEFVTVVETIPTKDLTRYLQWRGEKPTWQG
jgi:hypothetical protein